MSITLNSVAKGIQRMGKDVVNNVKAKSRGFEAAGSKKQIDIGLRATAAALVALGIAVSAGAAAVTTVVFAAVVGIGTLYYLTPLTLEDRGAAIVSGWFSSAKQQVKAHIK